MKMYMYQNTSASVRKYQGLQGNSELVAPGDIFESKKKLNSSFFKAIKEDAFKDVNEKVETVVEEPQEAKEEKPKKRKYFKKIRED